MNELIRRELDRFEKNAFAGWDLMTKNIKPWLPCNIVRTDNGIQMTLAVAGYGKENLKITAREGSLNIEGTGAKESESLQYVYRGLSRKDFNLQVPVDPIYEVMEVTLKDGLLTIDMDKAPRADEKIIEIK